MLWAELHFGKLVTDAYNTYEDAKWYLQLRYKNCTVKMTYVMGNLLVTGMLSWE